MDDTEVRRFDRFRDLLFGGGGGHEAAAHERKQTK
jgi:hypothetical protein